MKFEADIDLSQSTSRCNCSICSKSRFWKAVIPASAFQLVQGREHLADYRFGSHSIKHRFCTICGIKVFGEVALPDLGDFIAVNVACLDDLTQAQLNALPITYEDGAGDRWERPPVFAGYI